MQILTVSGFLGAGKTSFIKMLSQKIPGQFAILENDLAEINIDAALLKAATNQNPDVPLQVWEMSEGCVCCSASAGLRETVLTIANSLQPDYLIIEPSGVALPSRLLAVLKSICYEQIRLLAPICILDAEHCLQQSKRYPEYFQDQIRNAHHLIVSKSESLRPEDWQKLISQLQPLEQQQLLPHHYSCFAEADWQALISDEIEWLDEDETTEDTVFSLPLNDPAKLSRQSRPVKNLRYRLKHVQTRREPMQTLSLYDLQMPSVDALVLALTYLISGALGQVVRAKGFVRSKQECLHFELVEGQYSIHAAEGLDDSRAVVIGLNLEKEAIRTLFQTLS